MKTTIELPEQLLVTAKQRAAELHLPLRALIENGLRTSRNVIASRRKANRKIHWVVVKGRLPAELNLTNRPAMHDWLITNP
jgi:hypothetical protein